MWSPHRMTSNEWVFETKLYTRKLLDKPVNGRHMHRNGLKIIHLILFMYAFFLYSLSISHSLSQWSITKKAEVMRWTKPTKCTQCWLYTYTEEFMDDHIYTQQTHTRMRRLMRCVEKKYECLNYYSSVVSTHKAASSSGLLYTLHTPCEIVLWRRQTVLMLIKRNILGWRGRCGASLIHAPAVC